MLNKPTKNIPWMQERGFLPGSGGEVESGVLSSDLAQAADRFQQYFEKHGSRVKDLPIMEFGKMLVQYLEALDIPSASKELRGELIRELKVMRSYYEKIFGPELFNSIINGFLAEYAVAQAISEGVGYPVFYPSEKDDKLGGVDWWVDSEGDTILAVSVKCIGLAEMPEHFVYRADDVTAIDNLVADIVAFSRGGREGRDAVDIANKVGWSARKMVRYTKNMTGSRVIIPIVIILPSPTHDQAVFNQLTGEPAKLLIGGYNSTVGLAHEIEAILNPKEAN